MPDPLRPIDTAAVELHGELVQLAERLAEHIHAVWAGQRLAEGWRYGPQRDEARKVHPSLVPYAQLPDGARQDHRRSVLETLKGLHALGYRIEPPAPSAIGPHVAATPRDRQVAALLQAVESAADLAGLLAHWRLRDVDVWAHAPEIYRRLGERILRLGAPLMANEIVTEGLEHWPNDLRLRQLQGLALARGGAIERANRVLADLEREGHADEETLGILGRTYKDLGVLAAHPKERQKFLRLSYQMYAQAYRQNGSRWTGMNAATVALLLGETDLARRLAEAIRTRCLGEWEVHQGEGGDLAYWLASTLGESALILGQWQEAEDWYGRAAALGRKSLGYLNSTRRNAHILLAHLGRDRERIDRILGIPRVAVFVGHMVDRPGRATPRFPSAIEPAVYRAIQERLRKIDARVGYASAACGCDILFHEAVQEGDGEINVMLPYDQDLFVRDSVDIIPGAQWGERFARVLGRAVQVVMASNQKMEGGSVSYDYANLVLHGLASVRAAELETDLVGLAVWDGREGDGPGGTASSVQRWKNLGLSVEIIDLREILARECPHLPALRHEPGPILPDLPGTEDETRVMAMLFADAVKFSKLTEEQVPRFVQYFLGAIADLVQHSPNASVVKNTWGDGLYFVFETVRAAGLFALDLCDLVTATKWADKGLPASLSLRIALHAGPVYRCQDPITGQLNYTGTHVSRGARIEPITPPGQVYASQAFAALTAVEKIRDFVCEYVKLTPFAKEYGTFPTYLVRRAR
jgi:class 3 adenylate cyclase